MSIRKTHGSNETPATRQGGPGAEIFGNREAALLKQRLRTRASVLREEIRAGLIKYDEDRYSALADQVGDFEEQSVADLLADIDLSEIDRDVQELRDIESALTRMAEGIYGMCVDCKEPISYERLERLPSAARCHRCQERHEHKDPRPVYRTL